jgi:putative ABC transport system permease protein
LVIVLTMLKLLPLVLLLVVGLPHISLSHIIPTTMPTAQALGSGVLVLWSALLATRDARLREAAVFRALGASRRQISLAQAIELVLVGGVAGLLAAAAALGIGAALAERVFSLSLDVRWEVLYIGAGLGAGISLLAGWIALRPVLRTPAWRTLREIV